MFLVWRGWCLLASTVIMCFATGSHNSTHSTFRHPTYGSMEAKNFLHPFLRETAAGESVNVTQDDVTEDEIEVTIDLEDEDLSDFEIFDGSGDYSMYSSPVTFTVPYSPLSTAFISLVSQPADTPPGTTPVTAQQLVDSAARTTAAAPYCPTVCRLSDLTEEERKQLKGDPGPPGICECDKQVQAVKGEKGEPGESKYLVKIIGKDLPPIRSEVFKEALRQVIRMGLKGDKGEPGNIQRRYSNDAEFVTISRFPNLRSYSHYLEHSKTEPPAAEIVVLGEAPPTDGLYLRFGRYLYDLKSSDASQLLMTSRELETPLPKEDDEYADYEKIGVQRDAPRHERRNIGSHQTSFYNQSHKARIRALSLLKAGRSSNHASNSHCVSIILSVLAVFFTI